MDEKDQQNVKALEPDLKKIFGSQLVELTPAVIQAVSAYTAKKKQLESVISLWNSKLDDMDDFRARVVKEAWTSALKYGWCDEVRDLLQRLNIPITTPELEASVVVRYTVRMELPWDTATSSGDNAEWLKEQLHVPSLMVGKEGEGQFLVDPQSVRIESLELHSPTEL